MLHLQWCLTLLLGSLCGSTSHTWRSLATQSMQMAAQSSQVSVLWQACVLQAVLAVLCYAECAEHCQGNWGPKKTRLTWPLWDSPIIHCWLTVISACLSAC
jgi:hypothetical protein